MGISAGRVIASNADLPISITRIPESRLHRVLGCQPLARVPALPKIGSSAGFPPESNADAPDARGPPGDCAVFQQGAALGCGQGPMNVSSGARQVPTRTTKKTMNIPFSD